MEGLLSTLLYLLDAWDKYFPQKRTAERAKRLALGLLLATGKKTLTSAIREGGLEDRDWSADYRVFSRCRWSPCQLFRPILQDSCHLIKEDIVCVAYDDTLVKKTGKKIRGASWQRDPLSPPFNCNFVWGMKYLQASIVLPLYNDGQTPARGIPVQFAQLPKFKRPSKKASEDEWKQYQALRKQHNSSTEFVKQLRYLRNEMDAIGLTYKKLLAVVDGSYCNRTCLSADIPGTDIVARARKDARLYLRDTESKRRFYSENSFTPEQLRQDQAICYKECQVFYGGEMRRAKYKEFSHVFWRNGTKRRPLRLIVIAPTPYRRHKRGKLRYLDPAYLLSTDITTPAEVLIQKYLDRWQVEVNFQEEKGIMGLGQQQVWSEKAIPRAAAFTVATYGALLLAGVIAFNDKRETHYFNPLPKWRNKPSNRPSCRDLLSVLRREMQQEQSTPPPKTLKKAS